MPAIKMQHKEHGYTHVYTPEAQKEHEALGWFVDERIITALKVVESAIIEKQQEAVKRKPGRKPKIAQE